MSTDGSGNNTLNAGVIKSNTGSNTGLTIASDGQVTVNQNNPTIQLGTNATFPTGHIVSHKKVIFNVTGTNRIASSSQTWIGMSNDLNITHALSNSSNYLMFSVTTGQMYIPTASTALMIGIGKTTDLSGDDANIIRHGGDASIGRFHYYKAHGSTNNEGRTANFYYTPGNTTEVTYQPLMKAESNNLTYWTNNGTYVDCHFTLIEVQA